MSQLRGLFEQRHAGDEALLRLMRLRFEQAGIGAELHPRDPDDLERLLAFAPQDGPLPTAHLARDLDLLSAEDRACVATFARRFSGRMAGFVVHDQPHMADRTDALVAALRTLDDDIAGHGPVVFVEYASGHPPGWFADLGMRVADLASVSFCIDIGHVGLHQAHRAFAASTPDVGLERLRSGGELLARHVDQLEDAVATALPTVLALTRDLARAGKPLHLHLHDAHPLIPGLSDHVSFLSRVPLPFDHRGRRSLDTMFGPDGLCEIVDTAVSSSADAPPSLMLEIHQVEGRRPLDDAADLFGHWTDRTNAERTNHWLAVLAENARLL